MTKKCPGKTKTSRGESLASHACKEEHEVCPSLHYAKKQINKWEIPKSTASLSGSALVRFPRSRLRRDPCTIVYYLRPGIRTAASPISTLFLPAPHYAEPTQCGPTPSDLTPKSPCPAPESSGESWKGEGSSLPPLSAGLDEPQERSWRKSLLIRRNSRSKCLGTQKRIKTENWEARFGG